MSIKTNIEGGILNKVIANLAASEPITTFFGAVLAALVASRIDYGKVLNGDMDQVANLVSAVIIAILGYFMNHAKVVGPQEPPKQ